jgi:hypothetical protein
MEKGDKPKKSKAPKAKPKKEKKEKKEKKDIKQALALGKKEKKQRKIDSSIKQTVKVIVGSGSGAEPKRKEISKQTTYITLDRPYQLSQEDEDKLSITKFIKKEPTATLKTVVSNPLNEIPKANTQDIEITSLPIALDLPPIMEIAKKKRKQSRTFGKKTIGKIPVSERLTEVQAGYESFPSGGDDTTEEIFRQEKDAIRFLEKYQKPIELEEMTARTEEGEMTPVRIEEGFEEVQEKRKVGRPKKYSSEEAKIIKNIQTKESNDRRALLRKQEKIAQLDMEYQQFLENEAFQEGLDEALTSDFLSKSVDELGEQNNFSAIQSNQGPNEGGGDDILFE